MSKSVVIVESPGKTGTIGKYLGPGYDVVSSSGHVRDLPVNKKFQWEVTPEQLGVDPDGGWAAQYQIIPGKEKTVADLIAKAEKADVVYLATDRDREGEAIAWHLQEVISQSDGCKRRGAGLGALEFRRVIFSEITKSAIDAAFSEPGVVHQHRVDAQQARRFLDRVVGFMLSDLLRRKMGRGMSAGRVQSVAVRMIVEREREIRSFVPQEYWEASADLARNGETASHAFKVVRDGGGAFRPVNEADAREAVSRLRSRSFVIRDVKKTPQTRKPPAPFITATLQQIASTRLGFSGRKTMTLAQRLYEAGLITYMRTDSTNLSNEAVQAVRSMILRDFGSQYLPAAPLRYSSKAGSQEAHEAIRPTDPEQRQLSPLAKMEVDLRRLYELIRNQFIACQMNPAKYLSTTISVEAGEFVLEAKGRILIFDGFTRVLPSGGKSLEDQLVPEYSPSEVLACLDIKTDQHFTRPKPRYSEASLIKELDSKGIGRPSTFNAILAKIEERGYVTLKNKRFYAERVGELVTDRLTRYFANLMDYEFTQGVEEDLDRVANGETEWKGVLDSFYRDFKSSLNAASERDGMPRNPSIEVDIPCTDCGRPMQLRTAKTGVFLGCSGYAQPKASRCSATMNLQLASELPASDDDELEGLLKNRRCEQCGWVMMSYVIDEKRLLHLCSNTQECTRAEIELGEFRLPGYEGPVIDCDRCGAEMQKKSGRYGDYFDCTSSNCKNTRNIKKSGQVAAPKADPIPMPELRCEGLDDHYVLRDGEAGIFLAASKFPKHRKTRSPKVSELLRYAQKIDKKYQYLLAAPIQAPDGAEAVIRFSKKQKEHFVTIEGKGRGLWRCVYRDGEWRQPSPGDTPSRS